MFHVDPLDVIARPVTDLPMMRRLAASAHADLTDEPDADIHLDTEGE